MRHRGITALLVSLLVTLAACSGAGSPGVGHGPQGENAVGAGNDQLGIYALPAAPLDDVSFVVAQNGDDGAAGTSAAPLRTIDAAAKRAKPGNTVLVRDGTYTGNLKTEAAGTASARIAYVAESPNVKIVGTDGQEGVWENNGDYVDIVGFEISGPNGIGIYDRGSHVRIMKNRVQDMAGNCIYTQNDDYSLTDIDVLGNITSGCGSSSLDHGIYVSHRGGVVANNISSGGTGFGIQCWHACSDMVIVNNLVFYNHEGGIVIGGEDGTADNCLVANNLAIDNGRNGIREGGESGPNNRFVNNLLWDNGRDKILIQNGQEQGTIVADPQFVDYKRNGSGDYHVKAASPAVNAGTPEMAPPVAIDQKSRPQSGAFDVGPYEQ
jgi:hypothetical protein